MGIEEPADNGGTEVVRLQHPRASCEGSCGRRGGVKGASACARSGLDGLVLEDVVGGRCGITPTSAISQHIIQSVTQRPERVYDTGSLVLLLQYGHGMKKLAHTLDTPRQQGGLALQDVEARMRFG